MRKLSKMFGHGFHLLHGAAYPPERAANGALCRSICALDKTPMRQYRKRRIGKAPRTDSLGNLLALILNYYDPSIDFAFWKSLTIPDIYILNLNQFEEVSMSRLWEDNNP
jgi:2,3-bisphosphoglycerate-dependent phosphoglycerate mutase